MIPKSECPYCKKTLWDDKPIVQPRKGDPAVCAFCGEISIFDESLHLKKCNNPRTDALFYSGLVKHALSVGVNVQEIILEKRDGSNNEI